ncbi:hypothetical protein P872_20485 [Rhodonellum psychrophilum GCM71 = DSM 17998]|uniref:Glycosyl transferase family 1 domain-containing protein n=2 Tax=Rhodonellum TaxID=336827 RepID=U5BTB7_9BACT|nr:MULTISPECIES: glycosyltransferase [Rhodonellum]ERM81158.1 hypothetical protein P872_20485 [Rhodonellum psychrophilum GCM71 = DSM 17998]SDZ20649.1 Glycosyltransferase involved in cell wall bisynthesis [Rhodonellum ikkaensis]
MRENFNTDKEILVLTSYPPRECEIATYSKDLFDALADGMSRTFSVSICALENGKSRESYPSEVKYVLDVTDQSAYIHLAERINREKKIQAVFIQHEFGMYGGEFGEYLMYFLYSLNKPVYVTFHTVIPSPEEKRLLIVRSMVTIAEKTIVKNKNSVRILVEDYGLSDSKITIIPHGIHPIESKEKASLHKAHGYENKKIISTFGLLSSDKSVETALEALPKVIAGFPDLMFVILGKTQPEVIKKEEEVYRKHLQRKMKQLGLENHVSFVNRYLETPELLEFLQLTDIYLSTSKDWDQAVNGTLAVAMACGCAVVASVNPQAKELLSEDIGILVDFEDPDQLATALTRLLEDDELRERMGKNAIYQAKASEWRNVAVKHAHVLQSHVPGQELIFDLPEISLKHILKLTDRFGILRFSKMGTPDISSGYTLDDNAKALIAMCMHLEFKKDPMTFLLMHKYLSLMESCQREDGVFFNYVDSEGNEHLQNAGDNLEDANGGAIWALGTLVAHREHLPANFIIRAEMCIHRAVYWVKELESPRAIAFAIKGLYLYNQSHQYRHIRELILSLADVLLEKYHAVSDAEWQWFEEYMTCGNSILPESLLYANFLDGKEKYSSIAKTTFDFLLSKTFEGKSIKVISNKGWLQKGEDRSQEGGGQPIEVSNTIQSLQLFHQVFDEEGYREKMEIAFSWFLGNNHLHQLIYNPLTCGCHDSLEKENVNLNQGAESTISYLMARLTMEKAGKGIPFLQDASLVEYQDLERRLIGRNSKFYQKNKH